eukprot:TRINITY_DN6428_c0_g1_i2.p1 TRINITY_DN6428_c0_g1~~TRINITY_DN6428_c0_g1_i2.p1  ORF type:complete len:207 (+),score=35.19 TRINITY_DN6428_c0_g1_i2:1-621(+)
MKFSILVTLALTLSVAQAMTPETRTHILNLFAMRNTAPYVPERDGLITYEPINHGFRALTVPVKFLDKVLPKIPAMLGMDIPKSKMDQIMGVAQKCNNQVFNEAVPDANGNVMTKEGFSFKTLEYFISCKGHTDKVDMVLFTNYISGTYTQIQKVERQCKTSKLDPKKEECKDVIVYYDRPFDGPLKKEVRKAVNSLFLALNVADI